MVEHSVTGANYCPDTYLIMLVLRQKPILTAAALANNSSRTHKKSKHEAIVANLNWYMAKHCAF